jgi:sulfide dehydrogenase [flavocytochrome c] flavoprotein chain
MKISRRSVAAGLASLTVSQLARGAAVARATIIGGGYGGASVARALKDLDPSIRITLVEREAQFYSCPFSNGVLGGLWSLDRIRFGYERLSTQGIDVLHDTVTVIEPDSRSVVLASGRRLDGDFIVAAPGIQFQWGAIEGYSESVAEKMPHAWKAGPQTSLLRRQLISMVISVPPPPYRCPPGPYERICLIAHFLKTMKPRSKILVLDAQDSFSKQPLFEEAWASLYPGIIERVPGLDSGRVRKVDPRSMTLTTDFDDHRAAVANIIPPQKAAQVLIDAGLDDGTGWCPVDPISFESTRAKGVYILGDAGMAGDMPKSAFSANVQAKSCAAAIAAVRAGRNPIPTKLVNVCFSLAAPDYGFSIADVYEQQPGKIVLLDRNGRTTPTGSGPDVHKREAEFARSWFDTLTNEIFG